MRMPESNLAGPHEIIPESGGAIISEQRAGFIGIGIFQRHADFWPWRRSRILILAKSQREP
jgi:hypothetical protein